MSETTASPKIVEENIGEKVPFTIENESWININDEFNINLAKKERDADVDIIITKDHYGNYINGKAGCAYVMVIHIPARMYTKNLTSETDGVESYSKVAIPFDMSRVVIRLWAI